MTTFNLVNLNRSDIYTHNVSIKIVPRTTSQKNNIYKA